MNWCEVTPQSLIGRHGRNLCLFIPRLEKLKKERIVLLHSFIDSFFGLFIHIIQVKKSYHSPSRPHLVKVRLLTDSSHKSKSKISTKLGCCTAKISLYTKAWMLRDVHWLVPKPMQFNSKHCKMVTPDTTYSNLPYKAKPLQVQLCYTWSILVDKQPSISHQMNNLKNKFSSSIIKSKDSRERFPFKKL